MRPGRSYEFAYTAYAFLLIYLALTLGCSGSGRAVPTSGMVVDVDTETVYAVVLSTRKHRLSGENPTVGLFFSHDSGQTWQHTGWKQGRTFAVTALKGTDTLFTASGNGVLRTVDGGRSWKITTDWRITEVQDVTVNPHRHQQIFAATPYGIFRSDDLGDSWSERSKGLASRFVAAVRVDQTNPDRVLAGTEAGLFVSEDGGETWSATTVIEPVRSVRQSAADPARWVTGLHERGVALSEDGGRTWRYGEGAVSNYTIYASELHPVRPNVVYVGGWETGVLRSDDFGQTWHRSTNGLSDFALNVHGLAVSHVRPNHLFAGTMGGGLFESFDDGASWRPVAPGLFDLAQVWDLYVEGTP